MNPRELKLREIWLCKKVRTQLGVLNGKRISFLLTPQIVLCIGLEAAGALMDIHALQKSRGFRHWHTWIMCFNVGQSSQLRDSRVPGRTTSQRSSFNTSSTETVALMATGMWLFLCYPSFWSGWAVSKRSLPLGMSCSTSTEFQCPVKNIYRQEKEETIRLMTLQYSFRQGTLWYHNKLILLWQQVSNHINFSMQGNTQTYLKTLTIFLITNKTVSFGKCRITQCATGREGEHVRCVGLCLHEGMQLCLHFKLI